MADGKVIIETDLDTKGIDKGIKGLSGKLSTFKGAFIKGTTVAVGAATTAIATLTGASVKAFASYEQLVGGVDTLFKDASQKVQEYASKSYKTAQISGNQYMEQVTGFSASLLQSLGGDTQKAADYANRAVIDMSDNANKMGTSIESIQWAYQGFAKQNYTMLDNLKLGYGGTKEEMKRLITDASKMTDVQKELNVTVKDGDLSFGNIVNAISVMQQSLGIAGTSAKEASTTIEGSFNSMKASWEDLMAGFGRDDANLDVLFDNFMQSVETFGKNVLPRIVIILQNIGTTIETYLPQVAQKVPTVIAEYLPMFIESGMKLVLSMLTGMSQALPTIVPTLITALGQLLNTIIGYLPQFIDIGLNIISSIGTGIVQGLPQLLSDIPVSLQAIVGAFGAIKLGTTIQSMFNGVQGIITQFKDLKKVVELFTLADSEMSVAQAVSTGVLSAKEAVVALLTGQMTLAEFATAMWTKAQAGLNAVMAANPVAIVVTAIVALVAILVVAYNKCEGFRKIVDNVAKTVVNFFKSLPETISGIWNSISTFFTSTVPTVIGDAFETVKSTIQSAIDSVVQFFIELPDKIAKAIDMAINYVINWGQNMYAKAVEVGSNFVNVVVEFFQTLPERIGYFIGYVLGTIARWAVDMYNKAVETGTNFIDGVIEFFTELPGNIQTWLDNTINDITTWAAETGTQAKDMATNFVNSIIEYVKELPGQFLEWLTTTLNNIITWANDSWNKAKDAGRNIVNGVIDSVKTIPGKVWSWLTNTVSKIVAFGSNALSKAKKAGKNIFNGIVDTVKSIPDKVYNIGKNVVKGIFNGINDMVGWLKSKITGFANGVVKGFKDAFGIKSPSRVMKKEVGKFLAQGISEGFMDEDPMSQIETSMLNGIKSLQNIMNMDMSNGLNDLAIQGFKFNQEININQPIASVDEMSRELRLQQMYQMEG